MQLTFNSTGELAEFLEFSFKLGERVLGAQSPAGSTQLPDGALGGLLVPQAGAVDVARTVYADGSVTTTSVGLPPDVAPSEVAATPRKRRTKAEIAAAAAAEADANASAQPTGAEPAGRPDSQPQVPSDAAAPAALEPAHGANPFAAATGNIAQDVQTALAGGAQTNQTLAQISEQQAIPLIDSKDPVVAIPIRAEQIGKLDAVEHMRRAREFIAAKGQQTYQRTFALAGLSANVMSYSPEQCATHLAAMEWLAANPDA